MKKSSHRDTKPLEISRLHDWIVHLTSRRGMILLAGLSFLLFILAGLGAWYIVGLWGTGIDVGPEFTPPASLDELATLYPEIGTILQNPELDSAYKDFLLAYQEGGDEAALKLAEDYGLITRDDKLRLTLELDTTANAFLIEQLEANGIQVTAAYENMLDVAIPLSLLEEVMASGNPGSLFEDIIGLEHVVRIRLPKRSIQHVGDVEIESLPVINANVWQEAGYLGKGITIGILDLGFDGYKSLLGGDLPTSVKARSFIAGLEIDETDEVHGTAVAEIIHDIAPEAELVFAAYQTDVEQPSAVDWLISQGVDIISHSAGSMVGPMDGTGALDRMVDRAVSSGVLWVNSAGNWADSHYRSQFIDEDDDGFHEFKSGDELMGFFPDGRVDLALNWDSWESGDEDYDLFIFDENMNRIVSSENVQNGPGDETAEFISYRFAGDGPYFIAFKAKRISRAAVFNFFIYNARGMEYQTPEFSVSAPATSRSSFTVGATFWSDDVLEDYSSRGPGNDGRLLPDISAPTGVSSVAYGEEFYGTSASAPHVAGAAALVWEANPEFTLKEVSDYLKSHADDLGEPGPDNRFGFGRLWLGEVPGMEIISTATSAQPTASSLPATHTATTSSTELTPTPTARKTSSPTSTAVKEETEATNSILTLGLIACVALPALLGLGGLGLLGFVIYRRQSGSSAVEYPFRQYDLPDVAPEMPPPIPPYYQIPEDSQGLCPNCFNPYRSGARFCRHCGQGLEHRVQSCLNCGWHLRPDSKFCPRCGFRR